MRPARSARTLQRLAATLLGLMCGASALADDSEVFTSEAYTNSNAVRPNILFIFDTSYSMTTKTNQYDHTKTYTGSCSPTRAYYTTSSTSRPACNTDNWFNLDTTTMHCQRFMDSASTGSRRDRYVQFNPSSNVWGQLPTSGTRNRTNWVECQDDAGRHGKNGTNPTSNNTYARNNSTGWGSSSNQINWNNVQEYTVYHGNYLNWYHGEGAGNQPTRYEVVRDAAKLLVDELDGVNLGLMRYDSGSEGGAVRIPVSELTATQRTAIKTAIDGFNPEGGPIAYTPLSETLYEAALYMTGQKIHFGLNSNPKSVKESRVGNSDNSTQYKTPMEFACQKNYIVYLTDGLPTRDTSADNLIPALDPPGDDSDGNPNDFASVMGRSSCNRLKNPDPNESGGECIADLAEYLYKADLNGTLPGKQNITTFMIGFGDDVAAAETYLNAVAKAGGSENAFVATDAASLASSLEDIFSDIMDDASLSFTSPTVSVNAFNRARNLEDMYVSVFSPSDRLHWPGNLKKYKLINGEIQGQGGSPAVNPVTGFFREGAQSFWSSTPDGPTVTAGGAASKLPSFVQSGPNARKLATHLSGTELLAAGNLIVESNAALTSELLNTTFGTPSREDVIRFARGEDITNLNSAGDNHYQMGDPMHTRPAVVIYGGTTASPDVEDAVIYLPTNDGYLHAFDAKTGEEKWAFVPPEFLPRLRQRFRDPVIAPTRTYALDGDVQVLKYDVNGDGIVTKASGDGVYLFFGFGRGGSAATPGTYYALDVTDRDNPKFMWKKSSGTGANDLPGLGQAWSAPTVARVNVSGAQQNSQKLVLIFGGGYDPAQENYNYTTDTMGNRVFMVDAITGSLLWSAGPTGSTANLKLEKMNNSIPGMISVLDIDADGYADRMYAGDMGGRIWRFDITNGQTANTLVTGGVLASLGAADEANPTMANTRRFYNQPDAVLITRRGAAPYHNIAIGSGYRGHPLDTQTVDRFYSIRDYRPFGKYTQAEYDAADWKVIKDSDLQDVTTDLEAVVPEGSPGWKMRLVAGAGEKVLADSTTVNGVILFPTVQPNGADASNPCLPATLNRAYIVRADTGRPYYTERSMELSQGGIAPEITVLPPDKRPDPPCEGENCPPPEPCRPGEICDEDPGNEPGVCLSGVEKLQRCVPFGEEVRTFWLRN
jgi:type IV pilus assembly protein PilY1